MRSVAELEGVLSYHERTKHHVTRYAKGPHWMDWANQPDPFRTFAGAPRHEWRPEADQVSALFSQLRRPAAVSASPLTSRLVGVLFELSLGLSAWKSFGGNSWALRCNPSSGNLHPTEGYLVCAGMQGLQGGVYHYSSIDHSLERRSAPAPKAWDGAWPGEGVVVGLSSIHWREAWKYGERAYRYCQHDVGHAVAAVRYAAAALGWNARLLEEWGDDQAAHLLGLDRTEDFPGAEREWPEALLWVGPHACVPDPERLLAALHGASWAGVANRLSPDHLQWPLIEETAASARKPWTPGGTSLHVPPPLPDLATPATDLPASQVIRQRRSAVAFDGRTGMAGRTFFGILDALMARPGVPPLDALPWSPRIHPLLFVHRVEGLQPGLYLLPRSAEGAADLRAVLGDAWMWAEVPGCPPHLPLRLLLAENVQQVAMIISCHQEIASDSAFSLGMLARFDPTLADGAWWYRRLFWEAGALGQVLYLEAEAANLRGTGIGCFFDDEVHRLLGLRDQAYQSLYHFTVGGAVEDPRITNLPPYGHLKK